MDADLFPSDLEVLLGSLTLLLRDEKETETRITNNMREYRRRTFPLMKKLFKPIAIQCHPDKIKDDRKNRFFLLGRKAYMENDIPTVLFILSKLTCNIALEDSELSEIRGFVDSRRGTVHQKKGSSGGRTKTAHSEPHSYFTEILNVKYK